jgi:hypothetical protein
MAKRKEQRKHKRFQVPTGMFVGIGPDFTKLGPLTDLSMTGLAFRYIGVDEPSNGSYLDIFLTEGDFFLGRIPFKTISDVEIVEKVPSSPMTMRRCAVRFRKLTRQQKAELKRLSKMWIRVQGKARGGEKAEHTR